MRIFRLAEPWALLLLVLPLIALLLLILNRFIFKKGVKVTGVGSFQKNVSLLAVGYYLTTGLILAGFAVIVFSLAKPQYGIKRDKRISRGVDLMIALDVSESMLSRDYMGKTRLLYAKEIIGNFIDKRKGDRIGVVTFATSSLLRCPATVNYKLLQRILHRIKVDPGRQSTTSIGIGLASALNRLIQLKDNEKADSKVVILVTDGKNNSGEITPTAAAEIAKKSGIKVYTIGIGHREQVDMELLKLIADGTGGTFFHSLEASELNKVFDTIDELEKTDLEIVEITRFKTIGYRFVVMGLLFLFFGILVNILFFKRLG